MDERRFIEICHKDFFGLMDSAVRTHMGEDAVIWFEDPIGEDMLPTLGVKPRDDNKGMNDFIVKQNADWGIDLYLTVENDAWQKMIIDKIYETGVSFIEWCERERDMLIIVTA